MEYRNFFLFKNIEYEGGCQCQAVKVKDLSKSLLDSLSLIPTLLIKKETKRVSRPALCENVVSPLHDAHQDVEGYQDRGADQELVQQHLLDDGLGCSSHKPGVQPLVPVEQDHREHEGSNHPESENVKITNDVTLTLVIVIPGNTSKVIIWYLSSGNVSKMTSWRIFYIFFQFI